MSEIKSPYTRYATENDLEKIQTNIKIYNNLDQIGLSNDDMSATDFLTNIKTINTALGDGDSILYLTTTNADNLHLSAIDKLNADTGKELDGATGLSLKITRTGDIHNTVTIEAIYNADNESKYIYSCNYYNDTISNFTNEEITTIKQIDKTLSSLTQSKTIFEPLPIQVAMAEGQTQFTVNYDTFDAENDTLLVQSGITMLYPNIDFTVSGNTVTLTEGVPLGRTIGMYMMKIVQIPMSNNIISYGTVDLEPGVTPLAEGHIHFVYEQE